VKEARKGYEAAINDKKDNELAYQKYPTALEGNWTLYNQKLRRRVQLSIFWLVYIQDDFNSARDRAPNTVLPALSPKRKADRIAQYEQARKLARDASDEFRVC
jgi:hypothetical protein